MQKHHDPNEITFTSRYDAWTRPSPGLDCSNDLPMTKQSFVKECDINTIMRKYLNTGTIPQGLAVGRYGDFSEAGDYLDAQVTLKNAEAQFLAIPAELRSRFHNDPAEFLDFVADPKNLDQLQDLGFLTEEAAKRHEATKAERKARQEASVKVETLK